MVNSDRGSSHWASPPRVAQCSVGALSRGCTGLIAAALGLLGCGADSAPSDRALGSGGALNTGGLAAGGTTATGGTASTGGVGAGGTLATGGATSSGGFGAGGTTNTGGNPGVGGLEGAEVQVDPYGNCPLAAVVNIHGVELSEVREVQVMVAGQNGGSDFQKRYSLANEDFAVQWDSSDLIFSQPGFRVPVIGLYADTESSVRILLDLKDGDSVDRMLNIQTHLTSPAEAAWVPTIQVKTAMTDLMEPGWTMAEISKEPNPAPPVVIVDWTRTIAFDERGAVRWALRPDLPPGETFTMTRSLNGNFLTGSFDTIVEVTRLGRTTRSVQIAGYSLHHELLQIGSDDAAHASPGTTSEHLGHLLVLASKDEAPTIQDHILELDQDTGAILNDWDLATILDPTRTAYIDPEQWAPGVGDWLHANGLAYSTQDESIIVSGRHQGVVKIRRDGTLVWILAPHEGWQEPQAEKLLSAVDAALSPYAESVQLGNEAVGEPSAPEFDWAFGQHSPVILPNGDLLLFDNGSSRHFGPICGSFSRAVIYRIDETAMTVRQMGQFIVSKAESSCFVSNVALLPVTGNLFIQPGSAFFDSGSSTAIVKEVGTVLANDGTATFDAVVFDATLDMSILQSGSFAYSYRGHRWTF